MLHAEAEVGTSVGGNVLYQLITCSSSCKHSLDKYCVPRGGIGGKKGENSDEFLEFSHHAATD